MQKKFETIAGLLVVLATTVAAFALGIWAVWSAGRSVLNWLKTGSWDHFNIAELLAVLGFENPALAWVIPNDILQWSLGLPAALLLVLVAACLVSFLRQIDAESQSGPLDREAA